VAVIGSWGSPRKCSFIRNDAPHHFFYVLFFPMTSPDWPIKVYAGIKSYSPPQDSVPSEVIPGVYEGGFQLWECTLDLLAFLDSIPFTNSSVCELGCGRGLPGIYAAIHGAATVLFQDFNADVIDQLTRPNAILNGCDISRLQFCSLGWDKVPTELPPASFDYVLASETIYRKEVLPDFVSACRHLVKPGGTVVVAAKRMYFGLSGGVFDLLELTKNVFTHKLHEIKDKSAYRRDIVVLNPV
jgi:predicted nicotinamide N-methyase